MHRTKQDPQERRGRGDADLSSSEFFLVFFPPRSDTVAGLGSIASFMFSSLVSSVFFRRLVWEGVSKPFGVLLQSSRELEGARIRRGSS
jgi:hypothetical protein